jgi:hypothetical protein
VVDIGGRLELFEAKWTELPSAADTANLTFVRQAVAPAEVSIGSIVCRASHKYPLPDGFQVLPVLDLA